MAKPIFTWNADEGAEQSVKPSINVTKFGDGYEQRVKTHLNSEVISWNLTFTGDATYISPINTFLRARGALDSFQWTVPMKSPMNETGIYVCREWTMKKLTASLYQIAAKFDRVYEANV